MKRKITLTKTCENIIMFATVYHCDKRLQKQFTLPVSVT